MKYLQYKPPSTDGKILIDPPFEEWVSVLGRNIAAAGTWPEYVREERIRARVEAVRIADEYSRAIGLTPLVLPQNTPIILTGHQPEFFHPGVWAKNFLLERMVHLTGAYGINLVVDTDVPGQVGFRSPCFRPVPHVCEIPFGKQITGATWSQLDVPSAQEREIFRQRGLEVLAALPGTDFVRRFATLCDALDWAAPIATDFGMAMTMARRRYESVAGTTYRELPVSLLAQTEVFRRFAATLVLNAFRFREVFNAVLADYRMRSRTRSAAQPFPDLAEENGRVELPFWLLSNQGRTSVSVDTAGRLYADGEMRIQLPASIEQAGVKLAEAGFLLVPKAIALTLFTRVFVGDLFIHGIGGGRYDRITDAVIERYYGIHPSEYCVASMSLLPSLGIPPVTDTDVAVAERRLKRFEHNPDEMIELTQGLSLEERTELEGLTCRKNAIIAALGAHDADRKILGKEIRMVNKEMRRLLGALGEDIRTEVECIRTAHEEWRVAGDRTYPFFFWDPRYVQAMVL